MTAVKLVMVSLAWRRGRSTVFVRLRSDEPRLSLQDWKNIVALMGYPSALPDGATFWA